MSLSTLVSVDEYLHTSYSPDREYLDGVVVERNLGEKSHSKVQTRLVRLIDSRFINSWAEQRVQVTAHRFRIPDVCVTIGEPDEEIFTAPPFICIEVLSREDSLIGLQDRIDDYLDFGVQHIWLIDPLRRRAFTCDRDGIHPVHSGTLATQEPAVSISLAQLFE